MSTIRLEITDAQLEALLDMADEYEARLGGGEDESNANRNVRLFNNFCKKNCIERTGTPHSSTPNH